jgi:hypothetical protein
VPKGQSRILPPHPRAHIPKDTNPAHKVPSQQAQSKYRRANTKGDRLAAFFVPLFSEYQVAGDKPDTSIKVYISIIFTKMRGIVRF